MTMTMAVVKRKRDPGFVKIKMEAVSDSDDEEISVGASKTWLQPAVPKINVTTWSPPIELGVKGIYGSHAHYNNLLATAMKDIRAVLGEERTRGTFTTSDKRKMLQAILQCYFKYLKIFKTMDNIFDQMVHPQKRIVIRKFLDLLIGRLLELQWQLVLCENSEICYFDEIALVEGVLPMELDMPIPKYYFHDPTPDMIQRDQWFLNVQERERREQQKEEEMQVKLRLKMLEEAEANGWDVDHQQEDEGVSFEDMVHSLQVMERARQGKGRYLVAKHYYEEEMRHRRKKVISDVVVRRMDSNEAAIIIQKLVRGFLARHRVKCIRNMEMEFLGMRPSITSYEPDFEKDYLYGFSKRKSKLLIGELEKYEEGKRKLRRTKQKQFEDAQITMYQKLQTLEGPDMAERFKYQLRSWMLSVREEMGKFPDIPKAEIGGSSLIILEEAVKEESPGKDGGESEGVSKSKKDKQKQKDSDKKDKAKAKASKPKKGGVAADTPSLEIPSYFDEFKAANEEYNKYWRGLGQDENPKQDYELKHIIREKRQLVATEIREQVDIAMKSELEYLKQVLEKRKGKKGKKGKGKGKGRGKGKGKKGKKKKGKDLTPDRTMESLFEELVKENVIRPFPQVRFKELIGQCSFVNGELRSYHTAHPFEKKTEERYMPGDANPLPSFGDVLRTIKDICILPMGSLEVHRMAPQATKSVLICGPPGSGKKTIVNGICTELRATLMDLTASNIAGKYPGKPGLKMLMHLIEKVGRAVQPVIILIDECEKTYMKKVPKTDKTEPKRLKKQLGKFLKAVTTDDLILLIGLSSEPWVAPFKVMKKDYQRVIYIPPADFGTRFEMWKETLGEHHELLHPDINYTLLTKLSHGWTVGNIRKGCSAMIQSHHKDLAKQKRERRKDMDPWGHLGNFVIRPVTIGKLLITMDKLVESIGEYDPLFMEQEKMWTAWWNKTPLQKARMATQVKAVPEKKEKKKGKKKK